MRVNCFCGPPWLSWPTIGGMGDGAATYLGVYWPLKHVLSVIRRGHNVFDYRDLTRSWTGRHNRPRSRYLGGKVANLALSLMLVAGFSLVSTLVTSPTSANAATCSNYAPVKANVDGPWGPDGVVQVSYNPCNRRVWGYVVNFGPPCQPSGEWCAAVILTQSNGNKLTCDTPVGSNSCNTSQASDANITSYADGYIVWGIQPQKTAFGETASW